MIGIIYLNENKQIISIIRDVLSVTSTDVVGRESAVKGVDVSLASIAIVEETELEVGDTLGSFTDVRDRLPKTPEQLEIEKLKSQIAQQNADNLEFVEFVLQTLGVE